MARYEVDIYDKPVTVEGLPTDEPHEIVITHWGDLELHFPTIDPGNKENLDDEFILTSTDGSYEQTLTVKDDTVEGDEALTLLFKKLDKSLSYSLVVKQGDGKEKTIFEGKPYAEIAGLRPE